MRKRNRNVYVRFTEAEYKQLSTRVKRSGQNTQTYMLRAALGRRIYGADTYAEFKGILDRISNIDYQLRKIGININQIARITNTNKKTDEYEDLLQSIQMIQDMRKEAYDTWQLLRLSLEEKPTEPSADA